MFYNYYIILTDNYKKYKQCYEMKLKAKKVKKDFKYQSNQNKIISLDQIKKLLKKY